MAANRHNKRSSFQNSRKIGKISPVSMKTRPKTRRTTRTRVESAIRRLNLSKRFQHWRATLAMADGGNAEAKHFTPQELAELWGVNVETIRNIFREEPGVLKISNGSKLRVTLRIPREVAERVHRRLAA